MTLTKSWNGTSYSIPQSGERGWSSLTNFLAALADNAQSTGKQLIGRRTATSSPVTVTSTTDCYVGVNVSAAVATVNLPTGVSGQYIVIADESGAAATYNITINPAGANTINGAASYVLDANKQVLALVFSGTDWKIIGNFTATALTPSSTTTLTNKSLVDNSTFIIDNLDNTKKIAFQASSISTGTTRTLTMPDADVSLAPVPAALGTANQVVGVNNAGTAAENKSIVVGTSGTDFAVAHSANTITLNLPSASTSNRGVVTTSAQSFAGVKKFESGLANAGTVAANDSNVTFDNTYARLQICTPTAARTYTLPTTSIVAGEEWTFVNTSQYLITVNASGGTTEGYVYPYSTTRFIATQATPTTNSHWIHHYGNTDTLSYTPTYTGFGTVTNSSAFWCINGDKLKCWGFATTGIVAASLASVTLPVSLTIASSKIPVNNTTGNSGAHVGTHQMQNLIDAGGSLVTATGTSTSLVYWTAGVGSTNGLTPTNGSSVYQSTKDFSWYLEVPLA